MPIPTVKDQADFLRLMLAHGRASVLEVIAWVDSLIANSPEAINWQIDLSMSQSAPLDEIVSQLEQVPGSITNDLPRKTMCSVLRKEWLAGRRSDQELAQAWFALYPEYPEDERSRHAAEVWQYLDEVVLSILAGDSVPITLNDAQRKLANLLEPYSQFELSTILEPPKA